MTETTIHPTLTVAQANLIGEALRAMYDAQPEQRLEIATIAAVLGANAMVATNGREALR